MSNTATSTKQTAVFPSRSVTRRVLGREAIAMHLKSLKTTSYPDTTLSTPSSNSRGLISTSAIGQSSFSSASQGSHIRHLAWSPTGALVATADFRVLRVWNPERIGIRFSTELKAPPASSASTAAGMASTGPRRPPVAPGPQRLTGTERVAWNPSHEAELASAGADGICRFWDVRARSSAPGGGAGLCTGEVKMDGEGFSLAWRGAWAGSGPDIITGRKDDTLVKIDRTALAVVEYYPQAVQTNQIAFSNSGRELFLTTGEGNLRIVDFPSMDHLHTIKAHTSACHTVAIDPRGRHLAIGGSDALVTLWDTTNFACRRSLYDLLGPLRSCSFTFDGMYLVAGGDDPREDGGIGVYHVETGDLVYTIPAGNQAFPSLAWHPSRYCLAYAAGSDGTGLKIVGAAMPS